MNDETLIQIVDAALAETALRCGPQLACRPGCAQCCTGSFMIYSLDAERLRAGYALLEKTDAARFARVQERVECYVVGTRDAFPGDVASGILGESDAELARFEDFANEEVCPVLDPVTQTCDLYASRPMTCRVFGPPVKSGDGLGVCELCFVDASIEEIAACEMIADPDDLESRLLEELSRAGQSGTSTVAYALWGNHWGIGNNDVLSE